MNLPCSRWYHTGLESCYSCPGLTDPYLPVDEKVPEEREGEGNEDCEEEEIGGEGDCEEEGMEEEEDEGDCEEGEEEGGCKCCGTPQAYSPGAAGWIHLYIGRWRDENGLFVSKEDFVTQAMT